MTPAADPILEARGLTRSYRRTSTLLGAGMRRPAFAGVDLQLRPGVTTGLVGASGAGKSSLARCLSLLEEPDGGTLLYRGESHRRLGRQQLRRFRSEIQLVFQDSARSFNPRWHARQALEEPLRLLGRADREQLRSRTVELARVVGLDPGALSRPVLDLSGGQLKRLNLARALSVEPRVLVLDEPFAGLDLSLQAQIANLLTSIQQERRLAYLYISHDLTMVRHIADEVSVLDGGRVVESGPAARVLFEPRAPATQALVAAESRLSLPDGSPGA